MHCFLHRFFVPTFFNLGPPPVPQFIPQVLKQVVNLSCYLIKQHMCYIFFHRLRCPISRHCSNDIWSSKNCSWIHTLHNVSLPNASLLWTRSYIQVTKFFGANWTLLCFSLFWFLLRHNHSSTFKNFSVNLPRNQPCYFEEKVIGACFSVASFVLVQICVIKLLYILTSI